MVRLILHCFGHDIIKTKRITPAEAQIRMAIWKDNYRHPGMKIRQQR
jgi:hypothetical protein